jgi:hypothetical protein
MSYSTDKARILKAIEKHGRCLDNRDLQRKCGIYGDNFKRAIKEIDDGNLEITPEPICASTLRTITHNALREQLEQNRVKYENTIKYLMDEAMKAAKIGVGSMDYCDPQLTDDDYNDIDELLTELGFKITQHDGEINIRWA